MKSDGTDAGSEAGDGGSSDGTAHLGSGGAVGEGRRGDAGVAGLPLADGGVFARLRRRNQLVGSSAGLTAVALCLLAFVWFDSNTVGGTVAVVVLAVLCGWSAWRFFRVAAIWGAAVGVAALVPGAPGSVGAGRALHVVRAGQPIRRRVPSMVIPIRTESGPLSSGAGLFVHGREDGVELRAADRVLVWRVDGRDSGRPKGLFLVRRAADGVDFAASSGIASVF